MLQGNGRAHYRVIAMVVLLVSMGMLQQSTRGGTSEQSGEVTANDPERRRAVSPLLWFTGALSLMLSVATYFLLLAADNAHSTSAWFVSCFAGSVGVFIWTGMAIVTRLLK